MDEPPELEEPTDRLVVTGDAFGRNRKRHRMSPEDKARHLAKLAQEKDRWLRLDEGGKRAVLEAIVAGKGGFSAETIVFVCRTAFEVKDKTLFRLAYAALVKVVTPRLLRRAWGLDKDERQSQANEILALVNQAIETAKSAYAEMFFDGFTTRKAVSLFRKSVNDFERCNQRIEPIEGFDPMDQIADRVPNHDVRVLLRRAISKLPPKPREAAIQHYQFGMRKAEIAAHHEVDESTVRYWLKTANEKLGLTGAEDENED